MTYAEYLAAEERSLEKHEFLDGEIYAMSGGMPEHAALAMAFGRTLGNALLGRPCRVFSSDARVRVQNTGLTTYPDVSVVCGKLETDPEDPSAITNPVLLVEVLSDSTEARDRGEKASHYRHLASLREYVLVSSGTVASKSTAATTRVAGSYSSSRAAPRWRSRRWAA
jgi:Uma2 family endonuclease